MAFRSNIRGITYDTKTGLWRTRKFCNGKTRCIGAHEDLVEASAHIYATEQCLDLNGVHYSASDARKFLRAQIKPITKQLTIDDL